MGRSAETARDGDLDTAPSNGEGMQGETDGGGGETEAKQNKSLASFTGSFTLTGGAVATGRPRSAGRGVLRRGGQPTAKTVGVGTSPPSLSPTAASQKMSETATTTAVASTAAAASATSDGGNGGNFLKSVGVGTSPMTSPRTGKRGKSPISSSHASPNYGAEGKSSGIVAARSPVSGATKGNDLNATAPAAPAATAQAAADTDIIGKDDDAALFARSEDSGCRVTGERNETPAVNDLDATVVEFPAGMVGGEKAKEGAATASSGESTTDGLGATLVVNFSPRTHSRRSSSKAPEESLRPIVEKEGRLTEGQVLPPDGNDSPCADDEGFTRNRSSHQPRSTKKSRVAPLDATGGSPPSKQWEGSSTCEEGDGDGDNFNRSSGGSVGLWKKKGRENVVGPMKTPSGAEEVQCARPAETSQDLARGRAGGKCGCSVM